MGIKHIIDSSNKDLIASINKLTDDQGVDYALDAVSSDISMQMLQAVKPEGKFIQYGLMSGEQLADEFFNLAKSKAIIFKYFHLRDWLYNKNITNQQNVIEEMIENFITAGIKLPVHAVYGLNNILEAITAAESSGRAGKIPLDFNA